MQQELNFGKTGRTREEVAAVLNDGRHLLRQPLRVRVTLTRNRSTMISLRVTGEGEVRVRMHEAFCEAPDDVLTALRRFIRTRSRSDWQRVAEYARHLGAARRDERPAPPPRSARGRVHDLARIGREVNAEFFSGRVRYTIEWGRTQHRPPGTRKRRAVNLGVWHAARRLIRIHPLLDDTRVSEAFVRYIVFHEMLHSVVPPVRAERRTLYHPPEFKVLERTFPDYELHRRTARKILDFS